MNVSDTPLMPARNSKCCARVPDMEQQTLRNLLTERNIRMDVAAALAGVSVSTISRICSGTQEAAPATVVKLARGLGVSARRMQALCDASPRTGGDSDPAAETGPAQDPAVMLREFMTMYGADIPDTPTTDVHPAVRDLRADLLDGPRGEAGELREAMLKGDLPGIAAELADCLYVLWGTALTYGLGDVLPAVLAEVHRANMSKDVTRDTVPGDRKLAKGPGFKPPRVGEILAAAMEGNR